MVVIMKNGILYIAFGDRFLKEFEYSVKTVKKIHPKLSISLFTDKPYENNYIDNVEIKNMNAARVKQQYLFDSPYDNTLYMDSDTGVVGNIEEIFGLMGRFDLAATHDLIRKHDKKSKVYPEYAQIPDGFPEYAGGIILFRKSKVVEHFFEVWRKNFKTWYNLTKEVRDQPSFRVSLWQCEDLHIHTLPPEFNIRSKKYHNIKPRIYHWHNMSDKNLSGGNIWL
jgi:hypothetical protein